jgi:hypothetical protein
LELCVDAHDPYVFRVSAGIGDDGFENEEGEKDCRRLQNIREIDLSLNCSLIRQREMSFSGSDSVERTERT